MNTKIILTGQVFAVAKKVFNGETAVQAQFMNKNENGGVEILQVKMLDSNDISTLKEGLTVKIPVRVTSYQGRLFYTQVEPMLK